MRLIKAKEYSHQEFVEKEQILSSLMDDFRQDLKDDVNSQIQRYFDNEVNATFDKFKNATNYKHYKTELGFDKFEVQDDFYNAVISDLKKYISFLKPEIWVKDKDVSEDVKKEFCSTMNGIKTFNNIDYYFDIDDYRFQKLTRKLYNVLSEKEKKVKSSAEVLKKAENQILSEAKVFADNYFKSGKARELTDILKGNLNYEDEYHEYPEDFKYMLLEEASNLNVGESQKWLKDNNYLLDLTDAEVYEFQDFVDKMSFEDNSELNVYILQQATPYIDEYSDAYMDK